MYSYMILGKLFKYFLPQFIHLWKMDNVDNSSVQLREFRELKLVNICNINKVLRTVTGTY